MQLPDGSRAGSNSYREIRPSWYRDRQTQKPGKNIRRTYHKQQNQASIWWKQRMCMAPICNPYQWPQQFHSTPWQTWNRMGYALCYSSSSATMLQGVWRKKNKNTTTANNNRAIGITMSEPSHFSLYNRDWRKRNLRDHKSVLEFFNNQKSIKKRKIRAPVLQNRKKRVTLQWNSRCNLF